MNVQVVRAGVFRILREYVFQNCNDVPHVLFRVSIPAPEIVPRNRNKRLRVERGRLPPPESDEKLTAYAKALRLKRGSSEWFEFFDCAAAERGRFPRDILSDDELLAKLPVLFRTLRGAKVDGAKLDELIERIREA